MPHPGIEPAQPLLPSPEPIINDLRGFWCDVGSATMAGTVHRHDDVEMNVAIDGPLRRLFGGAWAEIPEGSIAAFWASIPHGLPAQEPPPVLAWITVPVPLLLRNGIPRWTIARLLQGEMILAKADQVPTDHDRFVQWSEDFLSGSPERQEAVLYEVVGRLCRLVSTGSAAKDADTAGFDPDMHRVATMANFMASNYREAISVADVAESVHLHPHYAMVVFRRVTGTTVASYLTRLRVAEAQRLLITTDRSITDIGFEAGFGSEGRFHSNFKALCGESPGIYRCRSGVNDAG